MSNHVKMRDLKRGGSRGTKVSRNRTTRPKTFRTQESAETWAKAQGFKKYEIIDLKLNSKKQNKLKVIGFDE